MLSLPSWRYQANSQQDLLLLLIFHHISILFSLYDDYFFYFQFAFQAILGFFLLLEDSEQRQHASLFFVLKLMVVFQINHFLCFSRIYIFVFIDAFTEWGVFNALIDAYAQLFFFLYLQSCRQFQTFFFHELDFLFIQKIRLI